MKRNKFVWTTIFLVSIAFLGFLKQTTESSYGLVGDIKYSILNPTQFRTAFGDQVADEWVLMNGASLTGTELESISKIKQMPDARGVFIRGMNLGRTDSGNVDMGDTIVGTWQSDGIKTHSHEIPTHHVNIGNGNNGHVVTTWAEDHSDAVDVNNHYFTGNNIDYTNPQYVNSGSFINGIAETRPRNICLYVYIKVK